MHPWPAHCCGQVVYKLEAEERAGVHYCRCQLGQVEAEAQEQKVNKQVVERFLFVCLAIEEPG